MPTAITSSTHCISTSSGIRVSITNRRMSSGERRCAVEASLQATGMKIERMTHNDLFLELKRALNPLANDISAYRPPEKSLLYESARSQMANVNIEDELDDY